MVINNQMDVYLAKVGMTQLLKVDVFSSGK